MRFLTFNHFFQFSRYLKSKKSSSKVSQMQLEQNVDEMMETFQNQEYESSSQISEQILISLKNQKGEPQYNQILKIKALCNYNLRQYQNAEMDFLNINEYIKFKKNIYTQEQQFYEQFNLLLLYSIFELSQGQSMLQNIYQNQYKYLTLNQRATIDHLQAIIYSCSPKSIEQDKAYDYFFKSINQFQELSDKIMSLFNYNMSLIWKLGSPAQLDFTSNIDDYLIKLKHLKQNNCSQEIFQDAIKNLFFILSLINQNNIKIFDLDSLQQNHFNLDCLNVLVSMSEVLLQQKNLQNKIIGNKILSQSSKILLENNENFSRVNLLQAAFLYDTKDYLASNKILQNLVENKLNSPSINLDSDLKNQKNFDIFDILLIQFSQNIPQTAVAILSPDGHPKEILINQCQNCTQKIITLLHKLLINNQLEDHNKVLSLQIMAAIASKQNENQLQKIILEKIPIFEAQCNISKWAKKTSQLYIPSFYVQDLTQLDQQ